MGQKVSQPFKKYQKINFSFDIDGVLAFSAIPVLKKFNKLFKSNKKPSEIISFDAVYKWAKENGLSDDEAFKIQRLWYDPKILFQSPPVPGAYEILKSLYDAGKKPLIVSSREPACRDLTYAWFEKHFPFVDPKTINLPTTDVREERKRFKANTIAQNNIDWHFEDILDDAEAILKLTNKTKIVTVPHRYNYRLTVLPRMVEYEETEVDFEHGPTLLPICQRFIKGDFFTKNI